MKSVISQALKQYGLLLALVVIVVLFQILTKGLLLNPNNVASLIQQNAYVMILAIGMVMVIVARHIDLSVGSVVAFVGGVVALLMYDLQLPWFPAVLVGLAIGALIGCWQGFWVAYVGIPAFIVTLAGMLIFRGLAIVLVERTVSGLPTGFVKIANGSVPNSFGFVGQLDVMTLAIGLMTIVALAVVQFRGRAVRAREGMAESMGLFLGRLILISALIGYLAYLLALSAGGTPIILVIIGFLVIVYTFIMNYTRFGRHVYAVGGNLKAAQLSGIRTKRVDFLVFVNMGVLSAFAGIVTTSRAGAAVATAGNTYELDAIAAAYIGGAAVSGGIGKVSGAIVGALVMGVINMGLSILSVDSAYQQAIKGLVVLFAVAFDLATQKRRS
ncbi:multiple monosaccharide ABC transporter permease [Trueperella pyogenes]|uniref:multiple monosaccharide ABC transporter permease n=1 Tax=Trueperella pyogenes TaxID=1661 RepID=UPI00043B0B6A|nr:multiple monosaccharide ABC transporter permease [Trueperella pyogenes]AHU90100.1 sugar ABC transporter permease [Trueperella pyogenes]MDF2420521.1 sugar ABC transporter permease [Trueperella pyogenes]OQD32972.1 sugar ABC transporter permease [Trueperella pyogenes]